MFKIPKREYPAVFKELAVKRVKAGQGIGPLANPSQIRRRPGLESRP